MLEFRARARGIPCIVRVTNYEPAVPAHFRGHPDGWEPGEPEEIELEILDSRGRRAQWLENKLDSSDWASLESQAVRHQETYHP